ncbi:MAG: DMT family transporter [Lachnospiraceae bacterium]|nr:DMT family transporter [Lachnospiraceae bacterium]
MEQRESANNANPYEFLLAGVISLRATSFVFSKLLLQSLGTFNLLAIRFLLAFFLLALLFHKRMAKITKKEAFSGLLIGTLFFLVMSCEMTALKQAETSLVSLLENCSIILVPVLEAVLLRRLMGKTELLSALIAMAGVFCLAASKGSLSGGVTFGLLAAFFYACAILVTGKLAKDAPDPLAIGIIQVGTMGTLSLIAALGKGGFSLPQGGRQWLFLAILAVICTGFGFTLQPVAQSKVSVKRAGLFCAINPAVASLIGIVFLHERMTLLSVLGLILILFSIALPHLLKRPADS